MKKENQKSFYIGIGFLVTFAIWTVLLCFVDIKAIGPQNSVVGFATLNSFVHNLTGVHMFLYTLTDWVSIVPFCFVAGFALLGVIQWIKRKSLLKVDSSIIALGVFYIVVISIFILFENVIINFRPVLIEGILEASYPSSTTMLVMCIMPTAIIQLNDRIKNSTLKTCVSVVITLFTGFMVIGRLFSGVHWFTDIIGGALLSTGLVMIYYYVCKRLSH